MKPWERFQEPQEGPWKAFQGAAASSFERPADEQPIADTGAPFADRLASSFKLTDEGKLDYLRRTYGESNAQRSPGGELIFREDSGPWQRFDETSFTAGDLADLAPDALVTAATLGKSAVPQVLARTAVASAANQGIGALLPGEEAVSPERRAGSVAADVGFAYAGSKVGGLVTEALNALRPSNIAGRAMNYLYRRSLPTSDAVEGERIAANLNVDLSPGARTGSKAITMAENVARQSIFSAEKAFQADKRVAEQFSREVNNAINRLADPGVSAAAVGERLRSATKGAVTRLVQDREKHAGTLYREAAKEAAGVRFPLKNAVKEIDAIIAENRGVGTPEAKAILSAMASLRKSYARRALDLDSAISARSYFGSRARGSGNVFTEALDKSTSRTVSARIFGAINRDFDDAIAVLPEDAAAKWMAANKLYKDFSDSIRFVEASPLARLIGEDVTDAIYGGARASTVAPEKIAERVLKLKPSETAITRDIIARESPETWSAVKAHVLDNALSAAKEVAVSKGQRVVPLEPSKFIKALPERDVLSQMFNAAEMTRIDEVVNAMRRWADRTGYNFSGTAPWAEAKGAIDRMLSLSLRGGATVAGTLVGTRKIAEAMLSPRGRSIIVELTKVQPGTRRAAELAGAFIALSSANGAEGDAADEKQTGKNDGRN